MRRPITSIEEWNEYWSRQPKWKALLCGGLGALGAGAYVGAVIAWGFKW